jgi:anti-sigma factor (TIGR02949 family)
MSCEQERTGGPDDAPMIDCETAVRQLWDYLDGQLDARAEAAVRAHISRCSDCFPHARFGDLVLKAVAEQRQAPVESPSLRSRVLERLRLEGYDEP